MSLGKGFDGGVYHLRLLGFLTFSIICYFGQKAVFQKWPVSIPEWKVEEASDRYGALEVSTLRMEMSSFRNVIVLPNNAKTNVLFLSSPLKALK